MNDNGKKSATIHQVKIHYTLHITHYTLHTTHYTPHTTHSHTTLQTMQYTHTPHTANQWNRCWNQLSPFVGNSKTMNERE
jgi:hypothetical protein